MKTEAEWRAFWASLSPDDAAMALACGPAYVAYAWEKNNEAWVRYAAFAAGVPARAAGRVVSRGDKWLGMQGSREMLAYSCESAMSVVDDWLREAGFVVCDKLTEREALEMVIRS